MLFRSGSDLLKAVDADNTDPEVLQYRVTSAPANGALLLDGNRLGNGSTFTQADIDSGRLEYEHDGSENFSDAFKFQVSDSVNDHVFSDSEGAASGESNFEIGVDSARNEAPTVTNTGAETVDVFGEFTEDFSNVFEIADADLQEGDGVDTTAGEADFLQASVSLKNGNGTNADLSATGGITLDRKSVV